MLMLNPYRRSVRIPGTLGACLVTGTEKIRSGYGNGDCLLMDFRNGLFAVADAAERFPQASRLLLERLATEVDAGGAPPNGPEFESLLNRVWSHQKFIHKTTLSCVALSHDDASPTAMLANNGDSSITLLSPKSGAVLFRSRADMNFAGRSRQPNPVSTRRLDPSGTTIVLATDGLADIGDIRGTDIAQAPDRLSQWIGDRIKAASAPLEVDDIGAIALVANGPAAKNHRVIMGGTRPAEETGFLRSDCRQTDMDRWDSVEAWQKSPEILDLSGIQIRQCPSTNGEAPAMRPLPMTGADYQGANTSL